VLGRFIKQSWLVLVAALVFGLLVAIVDGSLQETIERKAREKVYSKLKVLFGENSIPQEIREKETDKKPLYYVMKDDSQALMGYAFEATGSGFADKIVLLIGVDAKFEKVRGIDVLKTSETPGFGDKMKDESFKGQFTDSQAPAAGNKLAVIKAGSPAQLQILSITGATITSEAVVKIVNDAVIAMREVIKK
jgi:electron transport complex protein RnfG